MYLCRQLLENYINLFINTGPLPKQECRNVFNSRGCKFCLAILDSPYALRVHQDRCQLSGMNHVLILVKLSFYTYMYMYVKVP